MTGQDLRPRETRSRAWVGVAILQCCSEPEPSGGSMEKIRRNALEWWEKGWGQLSPKCN